MNYYDACYDIRCQSEFIMMMLVHIADAIGGVLTLLLMFCGLLLTTIERPDP